MSFVVAQTPFVKPDASTLNHLASEVLKLLQSPLQLAIKWLTEPI